ncbi:hypothetical protein ACFX15_006756 [Malus domestica]
MDTTKLLCILRTCSSSTSLKQGKLIHQKMLTLGLQNDPALCKNLIDFISSWNGLMTANTKNFMFNEALDLFGSLPCYPHLCPDSCTYPSVLKACGVPGEVGSRLIHSWTLASSRWPF